MNRRFLVAFAMLALGLSACEGSSFGGTSAPGGVTPPVNAQMPASPAVGIQMTPHASPASTTPPGNTVTYELSAAPRGLKCPEDQGFSCTITLSVVTPSPSGSPSATPSGSPTPTPTPTPTPSPAPSGLFTTLPSPSPTASGGHITLTVSGLPKSAPKMVNPDKNAVATVALVTLKMQFDQAVMIGGKVSADFTLPKEQVGGRGFSVQLYHETVSHRRTNDAFVGNYNQSKLSGTTLTFAISAPPFQVTKNDTWLLVLYGDELPSVSASPSASPKVSPSGSPGASPSALPSGSPSASPSASPVAFPSATPFVLPS